MKPSTRSIIITIMLSIALFIVGDYSWSRLFFAILPVVDNVAYVDTRLNTAFISTMLFSLTLALIPIATILIWKFAPIRTTSRKILTVFIIVAGITLSVAIWREIIIYKAKHLPPTTVLDYTDPNNPQPKTIENSISLSTVNFEVFALFGLVIGSVVSFFVLRQKPFLQATPPTRDIA